MIGPQLLEKHFQRLILSNTLKKPLVEPQQYVPYLILVCFAKSSALFTGVAILEAVKKAAKFAVYDEIVIRVKNHHIPANILVEMALIILRNLVKKALKMVTFHNISI